MKTKKGEKVKKMMYEQNGNMNKDKMLKRWIEILDNMWKQNKCSDKKWYIHSMECYLALKRKEIPDICYNKDEPC